MKVTANATRTGKWWAIEVPEIPGLFSQAKRLNQVAPMVVDAATMMGAVVEDVEVVPILAADEAALLADANERRALLRVVETEAATASRVLVARLRANGLPVRDVATLMGISPQRVSALAS